MAGPGVWFAPDGRVFHKGDGLSIFFYDDAGPGSNYEFANFFSCPALIIDGVSWPTTEHYFQAQRFTDPRAQEFIRNCATPRAAFECVRGGNLEFNAFRNADPSFGDQDAAWHAKKPQVMYKALCAKFRQNPRFWELLNGTGNQVLVEDAGGRDPYWGNGPAGHGTNVLGLLLMQVRQELRAEYEMVAGSKHSAAAGPYAGYSAAASHSTAGPTLSGHSAAASHSTAGPTLFSKPSTAAVPPAKSEGLKPITEKETSELAKKVLGTGYCPSSFELKGHDRTVVKLCFPSAVDRNNAYDSLTEWKAINMKKETLSGVPDEIGRAISFEVPPKFLADGMSPAAYLQALLKVANRIKELKAELGSCWTTSATQIKRAKIDGLQIIMRCMTDIRITVSFDDIISKIREAPKYRLDDRRILCFGRSNTTDTLNSLVSTRLRR
jgi:ribA/ribD-fused uncharacterized protein